MPRKSRATPEEKAEAVELLNQGHTGAEVAKRFGVSEMTVGRWRKTAERVKKIAPPKELKGEAASDDEPEFAPDNSLEFLIMLRNERFQAMRNAEKQGNSAVAQKLGRDLAGLSTTIARVEKLEKTEAEYLRITQEQLIEAKTSVVAKVRALQDRPLHCAECARKLSVRWGQEARKDGDGED